MKLRLLIVVVVLLGAGLLFADVFTEAPAGFDNQTNGSITQDEFDDVLAEFSEVEGPEDGLGPVFNADSCVACHLSSGAVGGASQVQELRAGHYEYSREFSRGGRYFRRRDQNEHRKGFNFGRQFIPADVRLADGSVVESRSLVNQRAICAEAASRLAPEDTVTTGRLSLSILGDGFVEAVPDETFKKIAADQVAQTHGRIHGQWIEVPILESEGAVAVGRFGWKNQHASLLSFSADAYLNEMGITSPLLPDEVTMVCQPEGVLEPNNEDDIESFASFMRATKVPPRGPIGLDEVSGESTFIAIGCAACHVRTLTTAAAGSVILGGAYSIPGALTEKQFHPYGDFLLHDIGTGDGIVQNGGEDTANKVRTMPLWGLRTRTELLHDGSAQTVQEAIRRHGGEAALAARQFFWSSITQKQQLLKFLASL